MKAETKVCKGATALVAFQKDKETRFNDVQLRYNPPLGRTQSVLFKIAPQFIMLQTAE